MVNRCELASTAPAKELSRQERQCTTGTQWGYTLAYLATVTCWYFPASHVECGYGIGIRI